ncbi:MAG: L-threonylcarbamoyladenylate synthase [Saprospiraceae bacterium]
MFLLRDDISEIIALLEKGGTICYPTDTIWGIGCDALNEAAIEKINQLKGGPPDSGYILLVDGIDMLKQYVPKIHPRLETLLSFHTRPLSIVYAESEGLPDSVKAPDGSIAIRVATDEFCQELIASFGKPLISTAACLKGEPYPPSFGGISSEIIAGVDYVVRHRRDDKAANEPSPVARLDRHQELEFVRE